jgi:hypothetical protein
MTMREFLTLPAALLLLAAPALAQQTPATPAPAAPRPGEPPRPDFAKMEAERAGDMALLLELTPVQRPALDAFLRAGRPGPDAPPPPPPAPGAADNFLQRLDRMEADHARMEARFRAHIAAAKAFYQQLNPHQRQLFEAMERLQHRPGPHGPGPHGPGPRGPHGPGGPDGGPDLPPPPPQD